MNEAPVPRETVAAISTPAGEGAIAIVRLSGHDAVAVANQIFRGKTSVPELKSHRQYFGEVWSDGTFVDQAMLSVHRSPHSYTGEDLVEISCHGGTLVSAKVLSACLHAGARAANPGEFTERAFLNGKLDLIQAEAVIDLIRARSDLALRSASEQLGGKLGEEFRALRSELIAILAQIEAALDFPEEGITPEDDLTIRRRMAELHQRLIDLLATSDTGRILREGLRVVIFGATNAGKSSLLNRLLGFERAIVSDAHGTTRDTIEENFSLRGLPLRLLDTAGLREAENPIEREGMVRTQRSLTMADLRLHIVDGNTARPPEFAIAEERELLVVNKSDLLPHPDWRELPPEAVRLSCKTGAGFPELEEAILRRVTKMKLNAQNPLAINFRHQANLRTASAGCAEAIDALDHGATPEMFVMPLRAALTAFDELLGGGDEEAVRDAVFNQFCIGK